MHELTSTRSLAIAALFLAVGSWWLANASMQANIGYAYVPRIAAQAAFALILGQALLIGLLAVHNAPGTWSATMLDASSYVVPAWPLLALLWLTSELSLPMIATSQVAAFAFAIAAAFVGTRVSHLAVGSEARTLLRGATGIALAASVWLARGQLQVWIGS